MIRQILCLVLLAFSSLFAQPNPGCTLNPFGAPLGGGLASGTLADAPGSMAVDAVGQLLIAATGRSQIVALGADGSVTVVAGSGQTGFAGDSGPALAALFSRPNGVARDPAGNIYVADTGNNRVRKIDTKGQVATIAGSGSNDDPDSGHAHSLVPPRPPLEVPIYRPMQLAIDGRGNLYILNHAYFGNYLLQLSAADGLLRLLYPGAPYGANNDPQLRSFAIDTEDRVVVALGASAYSGPDPNGDFVRILADGTRQPVNGVSGLLGLGMAMTFDEAGNLYVAEPTRIRRISPAMAINTMAGFASGTIIPSDYYSGELNLTSGLLAAGGNLFVMTSLTGIHNLRLANCPAPPQPVIAMNGVLDASAIRSSIFALSPGELVTIYGTGLGPAEGAQGAYHGGVLDKQAGTTRVLFNRLPAPVLYAGPSQVNAIVPFATAGTACVSVEFNGVASDNHCQGLSTATPGILVIQNQNGTVNSSAAPAVASSVVTAWSSGFGTFSPPVPDGQVISAPGALTQPVKVTVGGVTALVPYAGPAPGLVAGVVQLNIQLPAVATTSAPKVSLIILVDKTELTTTLWVK